MIRLTATLSTALVALLFGIGCDHFVAQIQDGGLPIDAGSDAGPMSPTTLPQFGTPIVSAATFGVSQMVAADFNGDGAQDLVVAVTSQGRGFTGSSVLFLAGYGDGAFEAAVPLDTGTTPQGLAVLDINGDGHPDFVVGVCADQANHLSFFINNNGAFGPRVDVPLPACPYALAVADFNGDGRPDVAAAAPGAGVSITASTTGEVDILYNLGGTFEGAVPTRLTTQAVAVGITAADLNGDQFADLAVTTTGLLADGSADSKVLVWLGASSGSLKALAPMNIARGGYRALAAGDLDGDGHLDLALVSRSTSTLAIALGKGDGTFAAPSYQDTSGSPVAIGLADFRQGGWLDVAAAESNIYPFLGLSVFPGGGKVPTPIGAELRILADNEARGLAIADFDGDGRPDIALSLTDLSSVAVIPALGGPPPLPDPATFAPAEHAPLPLVQDQGGPTIDRPEVITLTFQDDPSTAGFQAYADWIVTSDWLGIIGSPYGIGLGTNTNIVIQQNAPTAITDTAIQTLINGLILDGGVPPPTFADGGRVPEQVYFVYFPSTTTISGQALGTSCNNFGGYHNENSLGTTHFAYAVIPTCYPDFPALQQEAVSHELAEACSDPLVATRQAYTSTDFNAGLVGEIGDVCTSYNTSYVLDGGAQVVAQRIWSNAAASHGSQPCIPAPAGPYANVSPDQSLAVQKNIYEVAAGQSLKITVTGWTNLATVPFGVLAYPYNAMSLAGATFFPGVSMTKANLANGERASLTISVPAGTPTGSYGAVTLISGWTDDNYSYWPLIVFVP